MLSPRTVAGLEEKPRTVLCAVAHGFSLDAAVRLAGHQRKALERLCRTITRPALGNERPRRSGKGQVVLRLKSPTCDGTAHIVMHPQAFMQRPIAPAPPARRTAAAGRGRWQR